MTDKHEDFREQVVRDYRDQIKKYSQEIRMGDGSTLNYSMLFNAYWHLYQFSSRDNKKPDVDKEVVEKACNQLLLKIREDITKGNADAHTYCCLADIYIYRENNEKALECYDKAVALDESCCLSRGDFKNIELNDREGALEDYNKALAAEKDPERIELIKDSIESIDIFRNTDKIIAETDKTIRDIKIRSFLIFGALILYIIFKIYIIFFR